MTAIIGNKYVFNHTTTFRIDKQLDDSFQIAIIGDDGSELVLNLKQQDLFDGLNLGTITEKK